MSRPLRIFLDSNVLISALIGAPDAAPVVLVDWLAGAQPGQLLTSRENIMEVERNLRDRLPDALPLWQEFVARSGITIMPTSRKPRRGINAKDATIVAAALRGQASHFVTGDKRLLAEIRRVGIQPLSAVTPREMLDVLVAGTDADT